RTRHTRSKRDWSSDVRASELGAELELLDAHEVRRALAERGRGEQAQLARANPAPQRHLEPGVVDRQPEPLAREREQPRLDPGVQSGRAAGRNRWINRGVTLQH